MRLKGRVLVVHRIAQWRRLLGLSPAPFDPIPRRRPRTTKRYVALVERICAEESRLRSMTN